MLLYVRKGEIIVSRRAGKSGKRAEKDRQAGRRKRYQVRKVKGKSS